MFTVGISVVCGAGSVGSGPVLPASGSVAISLQAESTNAVMPNNEALERARTRLNIEQNCIVTALHCHNRPVNNSTMRMTSNRLSPPLGPYPQLLLCGQVGIAPSNIKIKTINNIIPKPMVFSSSNAGL
jgi:hypothetical protein